MRPIHAVGFSGVALAAVVVVTGALALRHGEPVPAPLPVSVIPVAPPPPIVVPPAVVTPPVVARCCACAMEENRRRERQHHHTITARYLGVDATHDDDGTPTRSHCTATAKVTGAVRFALVGPSPWVGVDFTADRLARMAMALPCPELSRAAYKKLYGLGNDGQLDGLGTAPLLRRGSTYTLTVADGVDLAADYADPNGGELVWTLLAIDP